MMHSNQCCSKNNTGTDSNFFLNYSWFILLSSNLIIYLRVCFIFREETVGSGSISGDEHALQVLVLLPQRQLQQENV